VADIEAAEKAKMKDKVDKIIAHGVNCFINRQLIYNYPEQLFADAGVMAIGVYPKKSSPYDPVNELASSCLIAFSRRPYPDYFTVLIAEHSVNCRAC
jgi:S-methylmethionine-dependent homocysteine/selenocysteine methylase